MKTASNEVITLLNSSNQFYMAEIYTFTLSNNSVLRYTSLDVDVSYNGNTFSSQGLLIKRGKITQTIGVEVGELDLEVYPTTANIGNDAWLPAARNGALDGASVLLQRLFYSDWNSNAVGSANFFFGNVSDIDPIGRTKASIKVKSILELLSVPWPLHLYEAPCQWPLYANGCGLNKTSFTVSGNVVGNNSNTSVVYTNMNQANNYFDLGVISFNSGNLNGTRRTIKSFADANNAVTLIVPLPTAPGNGATFTIYPGCDHKKTTCNNTFTNSNNFRGMPYIPVSETGI